MSLSPNTASRDVQCEWRRMLDTLGISDDNWPFGYGADWKKQLHTWIDENVDDICEQRPMHELVSKW